MVSLQPADVWDLKIRFLSSVISISEEKLKTSVNASEAWDRIGKNEFEKAAVFPYIVSELIEEDVIKRGNNPDEVIIKKSYVKSKKIYLLELYNDVLNHMQDEAFFGVTLNLSGVTITGLLISLRTFYGKMGNKLSQGDPSSGWVPLFEDIKSQLPRNEREWDVLAATNGIRYVCLKEAKFVMGNTIIPADESGLWIGKIESVDGFMMGTLKRDKSAENVES